VPDADHLTAATFSIHVGTDFTVALRPAEAGTVALRLDTVTATEPRPGAPRQDPFSLVFTGPPDRPLDQGTNDLVHPALGSLSIFIVPLGPDPATGRPRYEAIFN
jgi:hypothetical protein